MPAARDRSSERAAHASHTAGPGGLHQQPQHVQSDPIPTSAAPLCPPAAERDAAGKPLPRPRGAAAVIPAPVAGGPPGGRTRWLSRWKNCGRFCCCLRGCRSWCAGGSPRWSRCCRCCWKRLGWKRRPPCLRCVGRLSTRWKLSSCAPRALPFRPAGWQHTAGAPARCGVSVHAQSVCLRRAQVSSQSQPCLARRARPRLFVVEEVEHRHARHLVGLEAACARRAQAHTPTAAQPVAAPSLWYAAPQSS